MTHTRLIAWVMAVLAIAVAADSARAGVLTPVNGSPVIVAGGNTSAVAFSPNGRWLAVGEDTGQVVVLAVDSVAGTVTPVTGSPFSTQNGVPVALTYSPDGSRLAVASNSAGNGRIALFSVGSDGSLLLIAQGGTNGTVSSAAFSASGQLLASAGTLGVAVWRVSPGTLDLASGPSGPSADGVAFNPAGNLLAVADTAENALEMFTVDGAGNLTPAQGSPTSLFTSPHAVAFSPDGGLVATANVDSSSASAYRVNGSTGALTPGPGTPFATGGSPLALAFSPSGRLLATADSAGPSVSVLAVNGQTGGLSTVTGSPFGAAGAPASVAISTDGLLLATADGNPAIGLYHVTVTTSRMNLAAVAGIAFTSVVAQDSCAVNGASAQIDWGDGTRDPAFADAAGDVSGSHGYTTPGTYSGSVSINGGCSSPTFTVAVTSETTTTAVGCAPGTVAPGQSTLCTATVSDSAGAAPTGTIALAGAGSTSCLLSAAGPHAARCSAVLTPAGAGQQTVSATYGGDASHAGSSATTTITVAASHRSPAVVSVECSPGVVAAGTPTTCKATVRPGSGGAGSPTGTVTFSSSGHGAFTGPSACPLSGGSCSARFTPVATASGTLTITATYAGDGTFTGAHGLATVAFPPVAGTTSAVEVLRGHVRITLPHGGALAPRTGSTVAIPAGALIDVRAGTARIATAADYRRAKDHRHRLQSGTFSAGIFVIKQLTARQALLRARRAHRRRPAPPSTDLHLATPKGAARRAGCRRTGPPGKGIVRSVTGVAKGLYRTVGTASTTTITSARWTVEDRCDGTLTRVRKGRARVGYVRGGHRRARTLGPGQSLLVRARFLASRQHLG